VAGVDVPSEGLVKALAWHALMRTGAVDLSTGGRVEGALPLIYVDKNPWGRHLDDLTIPRNLAEANAFAVLVSRFRGGTVRLAYSSISFSEGVPRDGSESASKVALREVIGLGLSSVPLVAHDERYDTTSVAEYLYRSHGIAGYDAIHGAAAILEGAWYFVTGDDRLRRRLSDIYRVWSLPANAETPSSILPRLDRGAQIED
jgi:hypothetical protein